MIIKTGKLPPQLNSPVGISPEPVLLRARSDPLLFSALSDPLRLSLQMPSEPVLLTDSLGVVPVATLAGSLLIELLEIVLCLLISGWEVVSLPVEPPDSLRLLCILGTVTTIRALSLSVACELLLDDDLLLRYWELLVRMVPSAPPPAHSKHANVSFGIEYQKTQSQSA